MEGRKVFLPGFRTSVDLSFVMNIIVKLSCHDSTRLYRHRTSEDFGMTSSLKCLFYDHRT